MHGEAFKIFVFIINRPLPFPSSLFRYWRFNPHPSPLPILGEGIFYFRTGNLRGLGTLSAADPASRKSRLSL